MHSPDADYVQINASCMPMYDDADAADSVSLAPNSEQKHSKVVILNKRNSL